MNNLKQDDNQELSNATIIDINDYVVNNVNQVNERDLDRLQKLIINAINASREERH